MSGRGARVAKADGVWVEHEDQADRPLAVLCRAKNSEQDLVRISAGVFMYPRDKGMSRRGRERTAVPLAFGATYAALIRKCGAIKKINVVKRWKAYFF